MHWENRDEEISTRFQNGHLLSVLAGPLLTLAFLSSLEQFCAAF